MSRLSKQQASLAGTEGIDPALTAWRAPSDALLRLTRAAAGGDSDASATLIVHLGGPMLRVVRKVLGRQHPDVDDVTQDAVIAFLQALATFRGECSVDHFAKRVALLSALDARRRMQFRAGRAEVEGRPIEDAASADPSPLADTVASHRRRLVRELLDELPDVIAEALALHFILGHTVEEIASAASVSANTVWSRLRLGKRALRRKLDGDARLAEMLEVPR